MKKLHIPLVVGLLAFIGVAYGGDLPKGWYKFAKSPGTEVEAGTDEKVFHSKPNSFYLKCTSGKGGNINQEISGSEYAGKRIRLSAYLKSDNLVNDNGYGGQIWAYSFSGGELYMTSAAGNIKGTTDWKEYSVVFDIPEDNPSVTYGLSVSGQGTVWIDSISWEVVDKATTPLKNASLKPNEKPKNLP
jgi:hypothetical protein